MLYLNVWWPVCWSPVMKANSDVKNTIFKYLHLGKNLCIELSSVLKIKKCNVTCSYFISRLGFGFSTLQTRLLTELRTREKKRKIMLSAYMLKCLTLCQWISLVWLYDCTCLFDDFCGLRQKCFGYSLLYITVQRTTYH